MENEKPLSVHSIPSLFDNEKDHDPPIVAEKPTDILAEVKSEDHVDGIFEVSGEEPYWETDLSPKIVWLASYPNSGTSFTMTLVERASNLSTATNYGDEVTHKSYDSLPLYPNHEEGPFWEGTSENAVALNRKVRDLPQSYILTKTHCGARCVKCAASEYLIDTTRQFVSGCQKTSYRRRKKMIVTEAGAPMSSIKRMVHLIRNPFHNVVARFHLERKNMMAKNTSWEYLFPYNSTGFHNWCHYLDTDYGYEDKQLLPLTLYAKYYRDPKIPCHAEFFKWTQWHNYVVKSAALLGRPEDRTQQHGRAESQPTIPVHVVWYEDYATNFNKTFEGIMDFLELPVAAEGEIRSFRSLPTYADHYSKEQIQAVRAMIQYVATPETWEMIQHYF
jgi:Sulfotransferase domain